jgi:hypothetical protein
VSEWVGASVACSLPMGFVPWAPRPLRVCMGGGGRCGAAEPGCPNTKAADRLLLPGYKPPVAMI